MNLLRKPPLGQKVRPFVSKTLREFARGQECAMRMPWCNRDPATTVLCHVRAFGIAGTSQKPHDFFAWHGCSECHRREKDAGWDDVLRAMIVTQDRVFREFGTLTP